jgi:hypothetical protein
LRHRRDEPGQTVRKTIDLQARALLKDRQRPQPRLNPFQLDVRHEVIEGKVSAVRFCSKI